MSGFVYIWRDRKHNRYYIGSHWGSETDGYVCSSRWMKQAYKHPGIKDFKRRILKKITTSKKDLLEEENRWQSFIKDEELGKKYYNLCKNKNHWSTNITPDLRERLKQAGIKRRGWKQSEFCRNKSRETAKRLWANTEYRAIMIDPEKGRKHSEIMKGRSNGPHTNETKNKIANKLKGNTNGKYKAKEWTIIHPNGQKEQINNLAEFCRQNKVSSGSLHRSGHSKGYCLNTIPENYHLSRGEKISMKLKNNNNNPNGRHGKSL